MFVSYVLCYPCCHMLMLLKMKKKKKYDKTTCFAFLSHFIVKTNFEMKTECIQNRISEYLLMLKATDSEMSERRYRMWNGIPFLSFRFLGFAFALPSRHQAASGWLELGVHWRVKNYANFIIYIFAFYANVLSSRNENNLAILNVLS